MTRMRRTALLALLCAGAALLAVAGLARLLGGSDGSRALVGGAATKAGQAPAPPAPAGGVEPDGRASMAGEGRLEVLVTHEGAGHGGAELRLYARQGLEPRTGARRWRLVGSGTTGVDGVAAIPAAPGTYLLAVRSAGLAPRQVLATRRPGQPLDRVTVSLVRGVVVGGRVLARRTGEPVTQAVLSLVGTDDLGSLVVPIEERAVAQADAWGRFRFTVAPGSYRLEVVAAGFSGARLRLAAPQANVEVRLAASALVEGFVRGPAGRPAVGAEVLLAGGEELVHGATGASGGFAVEVPPGSYSVTARSDRSAGAWPFPVAVAAGGRTQGIEIRLEDPAALAGVVTGAGGAPVPGASIAVTPHDAGGEVAQAQTDGHGRFAVEVLGAGSYDVEASADGFTSAVRSGLALLAGERVELEIALEPSGGVEGTVRDGAGLPLGGVRVRAGSTTVEAPSSIGAEVRADEAGHYRLAGLDAGPWEVTAMRDDASSGAAVTVTVPPGSFATADLTLGETGRLEGIVTRADRGPIGPAMVVVLPRGNPTLAVPTAIEADGRYGLSLAPGEYRAAAVPVEGVGPGGYRGAAAVRIAPGQVSRLDLLLRATSDGSSPPALVQVLEPGGTASAGSLVLVTTLDDLRGAGSAITDEDGVARLDLAGRAGLLVRAFRGGRFGGPVPLAVSGPTIVALRASARLRGQVVAADGAPPAGFTLELAALGDDVSVASTTGGPSGVRSAQGVQAPRRLEFGGDRFDVADVPAGPVRLQAQTPSGRLARAELVLAPGELRDVQLTLEPGATVEGRVVDALSRAPVAGVAVVVLTEGGAPPRPEATTGAAGRFRLTGLPAAVRRLRLLAPGYVPAEREAELEHLGSVDLGDIPLEGAAVSK